MKVLVIGSLPPPVTERSSGLLGEVLRYRRQAADVSVLSPTRNSVAHDYLELSGPASALEIARAVRGVDTVIVQLEPGFPIDETSSKTGRALGLGALGLALRSAQGEVTLRLHSIHDLPRGVGGRAAEALWSRATRIEVGSEATRSHLVASLPEAIGSKVVLAAPLLASGSGRDGSAEIGADADLEAVTALVRARAASERASILADRPDVAGQVRPTPRVSLWEWAPHPGAGVPDWAAAAALSPAAGGSPARRMARAVLLAAEGQPLTRPLARSARAARRLVYKL